MTVIYVADAETMASQLFARNFNKTEMFALRYGTRTPVQCPPRFERMPMECAAASMPGIQELPCTR